MASQKQKGLTMEYKAEISELTDLAADLGKDIANLQRRQADIVEVLACILDPDKRAERLNNMPDGAYQRYRARR
jgi:hypothetical protein